MANHNSLIIDINAYDPLLIPSNFMRSITSRQRDKRLVEEETWLACPGCQMPESLKLNTGTKSVRSDPGKTLDTKLSSTKGSDDGVS
jgi:hypothetical protein